MYLEAWLTPTIGGVVALFLAAKSGRMPVAKYFTNEEDAKEWVEAEALYLNTYVEWVKQPG